MKTIFTLLLMSCIGLLQAQVENFTESDCNGVSQSVYSIGESGMPLLVASKGFDCSICVGQAPGVATFANQYAGQIQVWGAMRYLYSSTTPACPATNNWVNSYNWDNVFTFPDAAGHWSSTGTPFYYVIHPETHAIMYQGPNFNTAKNQAIGLLTLSTSSRDNLAKSLAVYAADNELILNVNAIEAGNAQIRVINIVGQEVGNFQVSLNADQGNYRLPFTAEQGVYILYIQQGNRTTAKKFVVSR